MGRSSQTGGTGLGLAIARWAVELNGGIHATPFISVHHEAIFAAQPGRRAVGTEHGAEESGLLARKGTDRASQSARHCDVVVYRLNTFGLAVRCSYHTAVSRDELAASDRLKTGRFPYGGPAASVA